MAWPRTSIGAKTKRPWWSHVVVAVIALLWPLFLYQNAAVLYLNVDIAIFANFGNPKIMVIFVQQAEPSCCRKITIDDFCTTRHGFSV